MKLSRRCKLQKMDLVGRKKEAVCSELQLMSTWTPEGLGYAFGWQISPHPGCPSGDWEKIDECVLKSQGKVSRVRVRRCRRQSSDGSCVPF